MMTIFALIILISPSMFFAIKYHVVYEGTFELKKEYWTISKLTAAILLISYFLIVASVGAEIVVNSESFKLKDYIYAFLLPGVAFSLIIYPETASELLSDHFELVRTGLHTDIAVILGWLLVFISFFWLILFVRL